MKTVYAIVYTIADLKKEIRACLRRQIILFDDGKKIRTFEPKPF